MSRTRRIAVDNSRTFEGTGITWIQEAREAYSIYDPENDTNVTNQSGTGVGQGPHFDANGNPFADNITYQLPFAVTVAGVAYTQVVVWEKGLVSFGPITQAQQSFMAQATQGSAPIDFPGPFIAADFGRVAQTFQIDRGVQDLEPTGGVYDEADAVDVLYIRWSDSESSFNGVEFSEIGQIRLARAADNSVSLRVASTRSDTVVAFDLGNRAANLPAMSSVEVGNVAGGADVLKGLNGDDIYMVDNAADRVLEDDSYLIPNPFSGQADLLPGGRDEVRASVSYALIAGQSIERLVAQDAAATSALSLTGNERAQTIVGNAGNNMLSGGAGDDQLEGGLGNDRIDGGTGFDTVAFTSASQGVQVDLAAQNSWDGVAMDFLTSIENALGSSQNDLLFGNSGANVLDGGAGGLDRLFGGAGVDTVSHASSTRGVQIYLDQQLTWDGVTQDFLSSIENAIGSSFNDFLFGNAADNVLDGGAGGLDRLSGGAGSDTVSHATSTRGVQIYLDRQLTWDGVTQDFLNSIENGTGSAFDDFLFGSSGDNVLDGGAGGLDRLSGGTGSDTVSHASSTRAVQIYLDQQLTWDGVTQDFLNSIENGTGSAFDDFLFGSSGDNVLDGGTGGVDRVSGGAGSDTVSHASSTRAVQIYLDQQLTWDGMVQDFLTSIENGIGSAFDDFVQGSSGNNLLKGGRGNDVIAGGLGSDTMLLDGVRADYSFTRLGSDSFRVSDRIADRDGLDNFSGIEFVRFADGSTVALGDLLI